MKRAGAIVMRPPTERDYEYLIARLDAWWGGRNIHHLLPRLWFQHFPTTSHVADIEGIPIAFIVGFVSPSAPATGYVHFIGVHPAHRRAGIGRLLYGHFISTVRAMGVHNVRAVTAPVNTASVAFHRSLGFAILPGDTVDDGVPVHTDYDGRGEDRVVFELELAGALEGPPRSG